MRNHEFKGELKHIGPYRLIREMELIANNDLEGFDIKYKKEISEIISNMNFTISRLLRAYLKNRPK